LKKDIEEFQNRVEAMTKEITELKNRPIEKADTSKSGVDMENTLAEALKAQ